MASNDITKFDELLASLVRAVTQREITHDRETWVKRNRDVVKLFNEASAAHEATKADLAKCGNGRAREWRRAEDEKARADKAEAELATAIREAAREHNDALLRATALEVELAQARERAVRLREMLAVKSAAGNDMGIFCAATIKDGVTTERTPWQDGWNAHSMALLNKEGAVEKWYRGLPAELRAVLLPFICDADESDPVLWVREHEGGVRLFLNVGDTFAYACADAEEVPADEATLALLARLYSEHGGSGLVAWAARRRGVEPLEQLRTPAYMAAREALGGGEPQAGGGGEKGGDDG